MRAALLALAVLLAPQAALSGIHRSAFSDRFFPARALQDATAGAGVVLVSTAAELKAAVGKGGGTHIVLQDHIDLTTLVNEDGGVASYLLGAIPKTVKSIRPLNAGQCVVIANSGLLRVAGTQLWLDGLYIRLRAPTANFKQLLVLRDDTAQLYMTRVTMQGDGGQQRDCLNCGLALGFEASLYAQDFGGSRTALVGNAQASYVRCTFARNTLYSNAQGSAIIEAEGNADSDFDTVVWLEGCSFQATTPSTAPSMLVDNRGKGTSPAAFYSDVNTYKVCTYEGADVATVPACITSNPRKLAAVSSIFSLESPFMAAVLQELDVAPSELLPTPGATPPSAGVVTPPIVPTTTTNTTTTDDGTTTITTGDGTTATTDEAGTSETSPNSATDEDATLTAAPGSDGEAGSISEPSASDSSEAVTAGDVVDRGQSNTGLVVGCAVGGAVVLLAVIAGLFLLGKRRGTRDEEDPFPAATSHVAGQYVHESGMKFQPFPSSSETFGAFPSHPESSAGPTQTQYPNYQNPSQNLSVGTASASATRTNSSTTPPNNNATHAHYMHGPPPLPPPSQSSPYSSYGDDRAPLATPGAHMHAQQQPAPFCALVQVPTIDSVTNYASEIVRDTGTAGSTPAKGAPLADWREHLGDQLDDLMGKTVGECLQVLPGRENRLMGGQAVVQIVEDTRSRQQLAIKFFLSQRAFEQEKSLYIDKSQPLGRFLPQLHDIAEPPNSSLRDVHGQPMPPCIIMEKGEAMDVWVEKSGEEMDMFTGLQVLSHIAERLKDLHAAGYVHRDIKPGNIMWLPRKKRWTLIDFGCAAHKGSQATTGFSLFYAAPEVLRAYLQGEPTVEATEALDAWSLGVLAIELFSGQPVFDHLRPKTETTSMILGEQPAPWEEPETARAMLRPLGIFREAVLGLIERNPEQRTSIHAFQHACRRSLSSTAT